MAWPETDCAKCGATSGEPCVTRTGKPACSSHSARPLMTPEVREARQRRLAVRSGPLPLPPKAPDHPQRPLLLGPAFHITQAQVQA